MSEILFRINLLEAKLLCEIILCRERAAGFNTLQQRQCFALAHRLLLLISDAEKAASREAEPLRKVRAFAEGFNH